MPARSEGKYHGANKGQLLATHICARSDLEGVRSVGRSNWNGRGLVCPRTVLLKAKSRAELAKQVYTFFLDQKWIRFAKNLCWRR